MKQNIFIALLFISALLKAQSLSVDEGGIYVNDGTLIVSNVSSLSVDGEILSEARSEVYLDNEDDTELSIEGSGSIEFGSVYLYSNIDQKIDVKSLKDVYFRRGLYNLNNSDFYLYGYFIGEDDDNRMFSTNYGNIYTWFANEKTSNSVNPGSLGFTFSIPSNIKSESVITLCRSHHVHYRSENKSVLRTYSFPQNTVYAINPKFEYFSSENNNLDESELAIYGSRDSLNWNKITTSSHVHNAISGTNTGEYYYYTLFEGTSKFIIPEGFSPNNDNYNDMFVIDGLTPEDNAKLTVYNRWGNKVYESQPYKNSWAGNSLVGLYVGPNELPVGTYYYIFEVQDEIYKGSVFINR